MWFCTSIAILNVVVLCRHRVVMLVTGMVEILTYRSCSYIISQRQRSANGLRYCMVGCPEVSRETPGSQAKFDDRHYLHIDDDRDKVTSRIRWQKISNREKEEISIKCLQFFQRLRLAEWSTRKREERGLYPAELFLGQSIRCVGGVQSRYRKRPVCATLGSDRLGSGGVLNQ